MLLTGIVELSSLNERQRGHFTGEYLGHKGPPRPAHVMLRSRRACLRLGEAQRPHSHEDNAPSNGTLSS